MRMVNSMPRCQVQVASVGPLHKPTTSDPRAAASRCSSHDRQHSSQDRATAPGWPNAMRPSVRRLSSACGRSTPTCATVCHHITCLHQALWHPNPEPSTLLDRLAPIAHPRQSEGAAPSPPDRADKKSFVSPAAASMPPPPPPSWTTGAATASAWDPPALGLGISGETEPPPLPPQFVRGICTLPLRIAHCCHGIPHPNAGAVPPGSQCGLSIIRNPAVLHHT